VRVKSSKHLVRQLSGMVKVQGSLMTRGEEAEGESFMAHLISEISALLMESKCF
jgi:hypothetical protein